MFASGSSDKQLRIWKYKPSSELESSSDNDEDNCQQYNIKTEDV